MRILFLSPEVAPFAKTGGLADVAGALPCVLAARGHDVRIMMPLYRAVERSKHRLLPLLPEILVKWGEESIAGEVMRCSYPCRAELPVYFMQQDMLFDRPSLYGENGRDYEDNDRRFAFFCFAALWTLKSLDWQPDIIHLHDWQTGLVPSLLKHHPVLSTDSFYAPMRTVFTIHNLAYQGIFDGSFLARVGLPWSLFTQEALEFHGRISLLKAGLVFADLLTTVSPKYALEIQTEELGAGLDGVLRARHAEIEGVLNGIDEDIWNPSSDSRLPGHFSSARLEGKATCRKALAEEFQLSNPDGAPIIGMITRLVDQKGIPILMEAMPAILESGCRFVLQGGGEPRFEEYFRQLATDHPGQVGVRIGYSERVAHLVEAGADLFLMPSWYEPGGLNQMYSMHYGTLPIVRRTGGLADTVQDATPAALKDGSATGFVFEEYSAGALSGAVRRAVELFRERPADWRRMMRHGMSQDFSWRRPAEQYEAIYSRLVPTT